MVGQGSWPYKKTDYRSLSGNHDAYDCRKNEPYALCQTRCRKHQTKVLFACGLQPTIPRDMEDEPTDTDKGRCYVRIGVKRPVFWS